jgi:hypothetical protein
MTTVEPTAAAVCALIAADRPRRIRLSSIGKSS